MSNIRAATEPITAPIIIPDVDSPSEMRTSLELIEMNVKFPLTSS